MIRFFRNLRRVQRGKDMIGRWVIEFHLTKLYLGCPEEYCLVFGVYKVKTPVDEGCQINRDGSIKGIRFDFRFSYYFRFRRARS
jgi:hypothetical protein